MPLFFFVSFTLSCCRRDSQITDLLSPSAPIFGILQRAIRLQSRPFFTDTWEYYSFGGLSPAFLQPSIGSICSFVNAFIIRSRIAVVNPALYFYNTLPKYYIKIVIFFYRLSINLMNALLPSSVHLYTPACSSTFLNTMPISFFRISSTFSAVKVYFSFSS